MKIERRVRARVGRLTVIEFHVPVVVAAVKHAPAVREPVAGGDGHGQGTLGGQVLENGVL